MVYYNENLPTPCAQPAESTPEAFLARKEKAIPTDARREEKLSKPTKEFAEALGDILDAVDRSIAIRTEEHIEDFRDLDLLRNEVHGLTCCPEVSEFYVRRKP